jgi:hypothetical protein
MGARRGSAAKAWLHSYGVIGLGLTLASVRCGGTSSDRLAFGTDGGGPGSSSGGGSGGTGSGDGGPMPDASAGDGAANDAQPSGTYPAFAVDAPKVVNNGGPVLSAPVIVTITWSSDPDAAKYDAFGDAIGASKYWSTINSEYQVGAATSGAANHVSITTPAPNTMSDQDLVQFVQNNAGKNGWPAPTTNTLYAVYLPPSTGLTFGGAPDAGGQDACAQGVGGYHDEANAGGVHFSYAIMPHCPMFTADDVIASASHEFNEAATDPFPSSSPAYSGFDAEHLSWEIFNQFQDELGDACQNYASSYYTETEPGFMFPVQRQWSNKSAQQGHNPCVPPMNEPYYNVTTFPAHEDTITVDLTPTGFGSKVQTKGFRAALNQPVTIPIGYFSDQPTGGPWTISATVDGMWGITDQNGNGIANGKATVAIDKTSGVNGDMANVTVTPTAFSSLGVVYLYITSVLPGAQAQHYLPILVGQN